MPGTLGKRSDLPEDIAALGYKDVDIELRNRYALRLTLLSLLSLSTLIINAIFALPIVVFIFSGNYPFSGNSGGYIFLLAGAFLGAHAALKIREPLNSKRMRYSYLLFLANNKAKGVKEGSWFDAESD